MEKLRVKIERTEIIEEPVRDEHGNKVLDENGKIVYRVVETNTQTVKE